MKVFAPFLTLLIVSTSFEMVHSQCVQSDFLVGGQALPVICPEQQLEFENQSDNALTYEWDFCTGDMASPPAGALVTTLTTIQTFDAIRIVRESESQYYAFVVKQSAGGLFRLNFGSDLSSLPTVESMGALGLAGASDIEFVNDAGIWYAMIASGSNLIRLKFTNGLGGSAASIISTNLGNFSGSLNSIRGLSLVKERQDFFVLATSSVLNTITIIRFAGSLEGTTTSVSRSVPGSSQLLAINVFKNCDTWYGLLTSVGNNRLIKANFGSDLLNPDAFQFITQMGVNIQSFGMDVVTENGSYYVLLATIGNPSTFYQLDFGGSVWTNNPVVTNQGSLSGLAGVIAMDFVQRNSEVIGFVGNRSNYQLHRISYNNNCRASIASSTAIEPQDVYYDSIGDYSIELKAFDSDGNFSTSSRTVHVYAAPTVDFSSDKNCAETSTLFSDRSVKGEYEIVAWDWDFAGLGVSMEQNPGFQFPAASDFMVRLGVRDTRGCTRSLEKNVKIYSYGDITPDFSYPDLFCSNSIINFQDLSTFVDDEIVAWEWNFNNGQGFSQDQYPSYIFDQAGTVQITLSVTGVSGCRYSTSKQVDAMEAPALSFDLSDDYCIGDTVHYEAFSDNEVEALQWDFGDGNMDDGQLADHTYAMPGLYNVVLTGESSKGCVSGKTKEINIHPPPHAEFSIDTSAVACSTTPTAFFDKTVSTDGAITWWLWDFHDGNASNTSLEQNTTHSYQMGGNYLVSLTARTENGCSDTAQKTIVIYETPQLEISSDSPCEDLPVSFFAKSSTELASLYWEIGTSYYTVPSPSHTFKSPGDYPLYLEATASNGCLSSVRDVIHVPVPLTPDFSYLKNCAGQEAVLSDITAGADPVVSREWAFDSGETFSGSPVTFVFQKEGAKTVTMKVTAGSGCSYSVSKQIQILPPPVAGFTADPTSGGYPLEVAFVNTSSGATDYLWNFNDGSGIGSTEISPVHTFDGAGTYNVELIASNKQRCEAGFSKDITTVAPLPDADIEMITLTPNADGSLKLIVTIHNKGNTILKGLPLDLDFSGILDLREVLEDPIRPGAKRNFVFSNGIANPDNLRYLCVSADVENDLSPGGNRMCKQLEVGMYVFPAFPNPTPGLLNIEWIASGDQEIRISLTDALGRLVLDVREASSDGLNRHLLDLSGLGNGIYYLLIQQGGTIRSQRIVVSGNP